MGALQAYQELEEAIEEAIREEEATLRHTEDHASAREQSASGSYSSYFSLSSLLNFLLHDLLWPVQRVLGKLLVHARQLRRTLTCRVDPALSGWAALWWLSMTVLLWGVGYMTPWMWLWEWLLRLVGALMLGPHNWLLGNRLDHLIAEATSHADEFEGLNAAARQAKLAVLRAGYAPKCGTR